VEIGNPAADPTITLWVNAILLRVGKYAKGVKIKYLEGGNHEFLLTKKAWNSGFTLQHFGNLIITELRNEFPSIGPVKVSIIIDTKKEAQLKQKVEAYVKNRDRLIQEASEDDLKYFYGCTRCSSFSLAHACTVTPERPAQCSKPWYMLKAYAVLAPESTYYPCQLIQKGKCFDPIRGEYEGVNTSTMLRTGGKIRRVYLHSIFDHPISACSCFRNIAFYIPEVDGIAIIDRGYKGVTPGGWTWTALANLVAGRQFKDGVASIGSQYLRSTKFLQADGGYGRIVWMTASLKHYVKDVIPELYRSKIATEFEAVTLEELKIFLKKTESN
jgi:acetyl-CoA decarbonylase/synthase complex subunit beta